MLVADRASWSLILIFYTT